jgi:TBC1 domain family member 20
MEPNGSVVEETEKPGELPSDPAASSPLLSKESNAKVACILDACKWKDIKILRTLATSEGGLVSDEVRRQACQCYRGSLLFETDLE